MRGPEPRMSDGAGQSGSRSRKYSSSVVSAHTCKTARMATDVGGSVYGFTTSQWYGSDKRWVETVLRIVTFSGASNVQRDTLSWCHASVRVNNQTPAVYRVASDFSSCKTGTPPSLNSFPVPPPTPAPRFFLSVDLTVLGTLYEWNRTGFVFCVWTWWHAVLQVHPCCSTCQFPSFLRLDVLLNGWTAFFYPFIWQ